MSKMNRKRVIMLVVLVMCGMIVINAAKSQKKKAEPKTDTARELYVAGKYGEALPLLKKQLEKDKKSGSVNEMVAVSLYKTGNENEARKYFRQAANKGVNEAYYYLAQYSFREYDFDGMEKMLDETDESKLSKKAGKEISRMRVAREMYDHVEKIVVVDTLVVAKEDFFRNYKISAGTGRLCRVGELPFGVADSVKAGQAFVSGDGKYALWSERNQDGQLSLKENSRLLSGVWDEPREVSQAESVAEDQCYPFMMPDGMTLYYAGNGENSIGGYDLFVTRKDDETGEFMKAQNLGMPYNSPADDYLLVVDEQTGLGWWASDRNHIKDSVTVYIYVPNALRENYQLDEPNLDILASLSDITHTWPAGFDKDALLEKLKVLETRDDKVEGGFTFVVAPGVTYVKLEDAKTKQGRKSLEKYVADKSAQHADEEKLAGLRAKYAKSGEKERKAMTSSLLQLENQVEKRRITLAELANEVRKAEKE